MKNTRTNIARTDTAAKRRAVCYLRVSTAEQGESGAGLAAQRAKLEALAALHDLEVVAWVEDAGASAKTLDRIGMVRVLELVDRREVDVVAVAKLDRATRSVRDLGELVDRLNGAGVDLMSAGESIDTSTAAGRLVLNILGSVAAWEREAIAERTSAALQAMMNAGERASRFAPYGYREERDDDGAVRWVPDADEQRAISLMRDLRAKGRSLRKIAAELEARGHTARNGRRLSPQTVANALERITA